MFDVFLYDLSSMFKLLDPAIGLVKELEEIFGLTVSHSQQPLSFYNTRICVTSDQSAFTRKSKLFLGDCSEVELVSLRSKACSF